LRKKNILQSFKFSPSKRDEFLNSLMRKTNTCELFYSKLNNIFYSTYPKIFQLLEVLKNIQTNIYIEMRSSNKTQERRQIEEKEDYMREI
jgi:hypothetical protein